MSMKNTQLNIYRYYQVLLHFSLVNMYRGLVALDKSVCNKRTIQNTGKSFKQKLWEIKGLMKLKYFLI